MKRLQIVIHNINIGYVRYILGILWQIFYGSSNFSIPHSEFLIPNSEFRNPNSTFRKKVVDGSFVFGYATSGSVHGIGQGIQTKNNSNKSIV